ncbi:MAG: hypothetical protein EA420_00090 [Candidatus Competibacteraceae bacterium]|nr:MAG: hypothetical protein EA420_00090 [Candidatus Competibacteraceae bacterium]
MPRLRQQAEGAHAAAQYNLGWRCMQGRGVPGDAAEGVAWFRQAAAQGAYPPAPC